MLRKIGFGVITAALLLAGAMVGVSYGRGGGIGEATVTAPIVLQEQVPSGQGPASQDRPSPESGAKPASSDPEHRLTRLQRESSRVDRAPALQPPLGDPSEALPPSGRGNG